MTVNPHSEGFDYTANSLGVTPVVEQKTILKIRTFTSYDPVLPDGVEPFEEVPTCNSEANVGGDFDTIWIGKDASMNFIYGNTSNTARHEIQSLAFEDGRTELFKDIKFGSINTYQEDSEGSGFFHTYQEGGHTYDDLTAPYYADSTEVPEPDPEFPDEPVWYDYDGRWPFFCVTKELRLPEGVVTFPRINFAHTSFDSEYERNIYYLSDGYWDSRVRNRSDINIFVPSTVSSFTIVGYNQSQSGPDTNSFFFGYNIGVPLFSFIGESSKLLKKAGFSQFPTQPSRGSYGSDSEYEAAMSEYLSTANRLIDMSDHVHIYLKNHTTVPTISFSNEIYFPIVFHVNEDIYDSFVATYGNAVASYRLNNMSYLAGLNPISIVKTETYGELKGNETHTPLSETKFSGVAITGSFNDLKDKPEIPDLTEVISSELHLGGMTMAADGSVTESHSDYTGATFTKSIESTGSYTMEAFEWDLGIGLHDLESKTIKVVLDNVTYQANPIMIQDDGNVVYYLLGALSPEELAEETDQEFLRKYEERGFADFPFKMHLCIIMRGQTPAFAIWEGYLSESAHTLELSMVEKSEKIKSEYLSVEVIPDSEINALFV